MVHNVSSSIDYKEYIIYGSSRLRLFFFFALHLEKLEALRKICVVAGVEPYIRTCPRRKASHPPPLCKFSHRLYIPYPVRNI